MNLLEMFYALFTTFSVASLVLSKGALAFGHCAARCSHTLRICGQKAYCSLLRSREEPYFYSKYLCGQYKTLIGTFTAFLCEPRYGQQLRSPAARADDYAP